MKQLELPLATPKRKSVWKNVVDLVNNPPHYTEGDIECIDAIKASMSHIEFCGYLKGCIEKYIWRYRHKGNMAEDLNKAMWYTNRLKEEVLCQEKKSK